MIQGSCLCGANRFELNGELRDARYCHCENCRKFSGTSPAAWAMADSASLELQPGPLGRYNSGQGIRNFCTQCGSAILFESIDYPEIVAIPLGVIDRGNIPAPVMHLWAGSEPGWCTLSDDLPSYEQGPPESTTDTP